MTNTLLFHLWSSMVLPVMEPQIDLVRTESANRSTTHTHTKNFTRILSTAKQRHCCANLQTRSTLQTDLAPVITSIWNKRRKSWMRGQAINSKSRCDTRTSPFLAGIRPRISSTPTPIQIFQTTCQQIILPIMRTTRTRTITIWHKKIGTNLTLSPRWVTILTNNSRLIESVKIREMFQFWEIKLQVSLWFHSLLTQKSCTLATLVSPYE